MRVRFSLLALIVLLVCSCASFTGNIDVVERDEFLYKLPQLHETILGNLKYDDPNFDLRELNLTAYQELLETTELVGDDEDVVAFLQKSSSENKFLVLKDTFLVCLNSDKWTYLICDDASTIGADRVLVDDALPNMDTSFAELFEQIR